MDKTFYLICLSDVGTICLLICIYCRANPLRRVPQRNVPTSLIAYSDADFASDPKTRKSTTGYIIFYCGGPITWCSRKQPIVNFVE